MSRPVSLCSLAGKPAMNPRSTSVKSARSSIAYWAKATRLTSDVALVAGFIPSATAAPSACRQSSCRRQAHTAPAVGASPAEGDPGLDAHGGPKDRAGPGCHDLGAAGRHGGGLAPAQRELGAPWRAEQHRSGGAEQDLRQRARQLDPAGAGPDAAEPEVPDRHRVGLLVAIGLW